MADLSCQTAGESHGPALTALINGLPAGLRVDPDFINAELRRRQGGYGRGARQRIESDSIAILAGVRRGLSTGAPVVLQITNRDARLEDEHRTPPVHRPRPGHADLAGGMKYGRRDLRDVLERASARETAARVAAGAVCKALLRACGIEVRSGVLSVGGVGVPEPSEGFGFAHLSAVEETSPFRAVDRAVEPAMATAVDEARKAGDTLGGTVLVGARGLPAGLGSHVSWERKLDGRIAQAILSIPAVKAVSIGDGVANAYRPGSRAHDPIAWERDRGFYRTSNRAGGLEGGMTNGEDLLVTLFQKPISTLRDGLPSIDVETKEPHRAQYERSDVTAVPACGVIAEAMLAFVLAGALLEKTGGDSVPEVLANLAAVRAAQRGY